MTDGESLLKAVLAQPDDDTAALVLADWLAENGAEALAVALRAGVELRRDPTVYLVSSGSYSDYSVSGVFSSRENAEKFMTASRERRYFNDVEEYELNDGVALIDSGLRPFIVDMQLLTGDDATVIPGDPGSTSRVCERAWGSSDRRSVWVPVWARDEAHAVKIANEKRIAHLAAKAQGLPVT